MAEFVEVWVTSVDVAPWPTQRYDVTLPRVVGDKYAHVWELFADLADTRSLWANNQSVQTLLYQNVSWFLVFLTMYFRTCKSEQQLPEL